ncbi:MAG: glutathione synthase [Rhodanobacteraceae bacterium]
MTDELLMLMDPIESIRPAKDTSLALLLEAQRRGYKLNITQQGDLALRNGQPWARMTEMRVHDDEEHWFDKLDSHWRPLQEVPLIFDRKDPPVDSHYIHDTRLLELAQRAGSRVVNDPQSLRDCNEKLFALQYPDCCAPSLVARDADALRQFVDQTGDVVLKPLDGMGGQSIFRSRAGDPNLNVILETLMGEHGNFVLAQKYLPEIAQGDKRILMIDGEPLDYALARMPQGTDFRGNLAAGGRGVGQPLSARDREIAARVGPELKRRGLLLVGLDVIGDWLTEINVTSPTCARELDAQFGLNIAGMLFDVIEAK